MIHAIKTPEEVLQYETMPVASASYLNRVVQYIGSNTESYVKGMWYVCTVENNVYSWESINTDSPLTDDQLNHLLSLIPD